MRPGAETASCELPAATLSVFNPMAFCWSLSSWTVPARLVGRASVDLSAASLLPVSITLARLESWRSALYHPAAARTDARTARHTTPATARRRFGAMKLDRDRG